MLNNGLEIAKDDSGRTIVRVTVGRGKGFLARFQPPVMIRTVKLDELGGFVLEQIDGKRTVKDIIRLFLSKYRINRREAELSVADFMKSLMRRGIISIAVK